MEKNEHLQRIENSKMENFDLLMPCNLVVPTATEVGANLSQGGEGRPIDVNFGFLGKQNMPVTQSYQRLQGMVRKNPMEEEEQQQPMELLKNITNTNLVYK